MKPKQNKRFYGWIIAACCFVMIGTMYTIIGNLVNLFIKPLSEGLNVSRGEVGVYVMIAALVSVAGCAVTSKLIKKYSLRWVTTIGVLCGGIGYIAMGFMTSLIQLYLISILLGICIAFATMIPVNMMISNWFENKRGLVTTVVFTATGVGGFLFTQIISYSLQNYGYQQAYIACGIIMLITNLPITLFLLRLTPEEMGQVAYGADEKKVENAKAVAFDGFKMKDVKKSSSFLYLNITTFLLAVVGVGLLNSVLAHLSDNGYSVAQVGLINSVMMIGMIITKPLLGVLFDKKGSIFTFIACCVGYMITIVLLGMSRNGNMLIPLIAILILSFAASITSTGPNMVTRELYGKAEFGSIYSVVLMVYNLGTAVSSPVAGFGYDLTGSYTSIGILFLVLIVIMMITITLAKNATQKLAVKA